MQKQIRQREIISSSNLGELHPLLQKIYAGRGVTNSDELQYQLAHLLKPEMKGIEDAATLLAEAIEQQQKLLIVGDFDADGATSTSLAFSALKAFGVQRVEYLVPNRFEYGYGLTPEIVQVAAQAKPQVIITVDNGISSIEGVNLAKTLGIKVVITDHHLAGDELPNADAIVNPNQPNCTFKSKALAGVGVIFYVMSVLRRVLTERGWFERIQKPAPSMGVFLDLVALGTIADIVPLDYNNRILVQQGLQRIRAGAGRPGINALLTVAGKNSQTLTASDIGFSVGPRLNAAGRLDDMALGIKCLLAETDSEAQAIAAKLDDLNKERKAIEFSMQTEAMQTLDTQLAYDESDLPWGLCLYDETWHQGVIGILASRIKDKYYRPTIIFADAGDDEIKGSARSVVGFHIRDGLDAIAKRHPELLTKFGGHAMAAGLSLKKANFSAFCSAFDKEVRLQITESELQSTVLTDGNLSPAEFTLETAHLIKQAGPWGQHFPEPTFEGVFDIVNERVLQDKHLKWVLSFPDQPQQIVDAILFNVDVSVWKQKSVKTLKLAYKLDVNEFRGKMNIQLLVDAVEVIK